MWDKRDTIGRPNESSVNPVYTPDPGKGGRIVNIGPSIMIKGVELRDHNLTIGPNGKIKADLHANTVVIAGDVHGSVHAKERVEIAPTGRLTGDIASPRITIADGAHFKGSVDMERGEASRKAAPAGKSEEVRRIPEMKDDLKIQGNRL